MEHIHTTGSTSSREKDDGDAPDLEAQQSRTPSRVDLVRTRSSVQGGQDGYSIFTANDRAMTNEEQILKQKTEELGFIECKFDENDPFDPRNMGRMRKWLIVLIVSASSLCV